ncbi:MAG: type II toxin-antitoxin system RelE/ParE family toxin, partial [Rhodospirillales bacterium]
SPPSHRATQVAQGGRGLGGGGLTKKNPLAASRDLVALRSNRFEALRGDRRGQYSIRVNRQWRVCFAWGKDGPFNVEIVDYH